MKRKFCMQAFLPYLLTFLPHLWGKVRMGGKTLILPTLVLPRKGGRNFIIPFMKIGAHSWLDKVFKR